MQILAKPELARRSTLQIGGRGLLELCLEEEGDFDALFGLLEKEGGRPFVVGKGSNVLFADGELDLILISCRERWLEVIKETSDRVLVRGGAGVPLSFLLGWMMKHGLSGLEGLVGIPGSLGGAVAMNAGSYGVELADAVMRVQVMHEQAGLLWIARDDIQAGYRSLSFPALPDGLWVIRAVELVFHRGNVPQIRQSMINCYQQKKDTQPILSRTCGCVFKNLPDRSAGLVLDECGLRGVRLGGVAFSDRHANFMVNLGDGTCSQALDLIFLARERVRGHTGLDLQLEIKVAA